MPTTPSSGLFPPYNHQLCCDLKSLGRETRQLLQTESVYSRDTVPETGQSAKTRTQRRKREQDEDEDNQVRRAAGGRRTRGRRFPRLPCKRSQGRSVQKKTPPLPTPGTDGAIKSSAASVTPTDGPSFRPSRSPDGCFASAMTVSPTPGVRALLLPPFPSTSLLIFQPL